MKHILLIATGGTIASKDNGDGLTPSIDVNILLEYIPAIRHICSITGISIMNIDSSNMNTEYIARISECIKDNYDNYDGFVITHGTDTCAYTAAALSYQLVNLSKPVILTGSQLPIDADCTDAIDNLVHAFIYSCEDISGVFLAFCNKLISGRHAKKLRTTSFNAFESINYPVIATIQDNKVVYNNDIDIIKCRGEFHIETDMCTDIMIINLFPGMDYKIFDYIPENTFYDFAKDVFPKLLNEHAINTFEVNEYWSDIGSIGQYIQSTKDLFDGKCKFRHARAIETDSGQYICDQNTLVSCSTKFVGKSTIGKNCIIGDDCRIENCIIWDNVQIEDGVDISDCVIASNCVIKTDLSSQVVGANEIITKKLAEI